MNGKYRVFTKKGCGTCKSVTNILRAKGVDFNEIDVSTEYGVRLASELGVTHSGAIVDENGKIIPLESFLASSQSMPKMAACATCG